MSKEAMKLALEALEDFEDAIRYDNEQDDIGARVCCDVLSYNPHTKDCKAVKAITALQEALAEQPAQQEPVGVEWTPCMKLPVVVNVRKQRPGESHVSTREGITPVKPDDLIMRGVSGEEYPIGRVIFEQTYSLDTSPPAQRKPLTDERIFELASEHQDWDRNLIRVRSFARAIEAAHGIKGNT